MCGYKVFIYGHELSCIITDLLNEGLLQSRSVDSTVSVQGFVVGTTRV